jgi:hypothetical protein
MHDLRIERGGTRMEEFVYGYCPCGWKFEPPRVDEWSEDRIRRSFFNHLTMSPA